MVYFLFTIIIDILILGKDYDRELIVFCLIFNISKYEKENYNTWEERTTPLRRINLV